MCVLTGGTAGIGRATLDRMAALGWNVIFTGRSAGKGEAIRRALAARHPQQSFAFIAADLSSLAGVRELAAEIARRCAQIDVLINNAGARIDTYQESADGFELTFATNHLGHFLLTALLLDRVIAAPAGRVVTLSSRRHRFVKKTSPWLETRENFERWEVYSRSKLANTLFAFELARRLEGSAAVSHAVDPGIVASNFARNNGLVPWLKHIVSSWRARQLVSCTQAAETVVYAATAPEIAGQTGKYFCERKAIEPAPVALDRSLADQLWRASIHWTGLAEAGCRAWRVVADSAVPRPRETINN